MSEEVNSPVDNSSGVLPECIGQQEMFPGFAESQSQARRAWTRAERRRFREACDSLSIDEWIASGLWRRS